MGTRSTSGAVPALFLLAVMGTVWLAGTAGWLSPSAPEYVRAKAAKHTLMDALPTVDRVVCDVGGIYLYAAKKPVMAVWLASAPAELYTADGDFAGQLSGPELAVLMDAARPLADQCLDQEAHPDERRLPHTYPL